MLQAKSRWQLSACDESLASHIARSCNLPPLLARLLVVRGIDTPEKAEAFLHVSPEQFRDPFLLDGMEKGAARLRRAIDRGEPICLYGDYDADGVSSTTLMIHVLRQLGAVFDYYIPNRFTEGYGLHQDALEAISQKGFQLVLTVDTGISAVEQVEFARKLGLDVIVTDHHEPPAVIPDAYAVINPKKPGCPYPFDMLAGVGVAFKLAHALLGEAPLHLADIAAIGTIADLVPLVDENRVIASIGLRQLQQTDHVGLKALLRECGLAEAEVSAGHVGFAIAPRINAVGRLETAETAVSLLTTDDPQEAERLARHLSELNRERQDLVESIFAEAEEMVHSAFPPEQNSALVLAGEGWNVGVVGIVASRLVERFYRPAVVLSVDRERGTAKGSARSIAGFDLYQALTACQDLLSHYGGHTMAAGMTLPVENISALRERLRALASEWLRDEDFIPLTRVDLAASLEEIDAETVNRVSMLAPFGLGNPTPLVLLSEVEPVSMRKVGRDQEHLKCSFQAEGKTLDAIGFGFASVVDDIAPKAKVHVVGELSINEWNGRQKPQLVIRDMAVYHRQVFDWRGMADKLEKWRRLAEQGAVTVTFRRESYERLSAYIREKQKEASLILFDSASPPQPCRECTTLVIYDLPKRRKTLQALMEACTRVERLYCLFGDPDDSFDRIQFPPRNQFAQLYQFFRQYPTVPKAHLDALARRLQVKRETLVNMLAVFCELSFVTEREDAYVLNPQPVKTALEASVRYQEWKEETELCSDLLLSSYDSFVELLFQRETPITRKEDITV